MEVIRRTLFEGETLQIGLVETRPVSDACGEVERQALNVVALPFSGVFSRHDGPSRHVICTPSNAIFIAANTSYRLGFPGAIGDRALALRFGDALVSNQLDLQRDSDALTSRGLLPANAMMLRNLLWTRLKKGDADRFESEALGLELLGMSLTSIGTCNAPVRRSALVRRQRAVERVKEVIALTPAKKWSVAKLAKVANLSPFHLCHVFRQVVGTSIYDYVLRERLARTLDAILDCDDQLTPIALDAGFASHSHFTAHFRRFFGCTPARLRRMASAERITELRKIMTAPRNGLALD